MNPEILNALVTFVVGTVALFVYWLSKRNEKRNAATIIIMDIRQAEQVIQSILEKGTIDLTLKVILQENNWAKFKHLFASDLSYDDFSAFNRFFDSCVEIADARKRIWEVLYANINIKAEIMQQKIFAIDDLHSPSGQTQKQKIIEVINSEPYAFDPDEPRNRIFRSLQQMGRLSNSVAFEKLKSHAGIKA